MLKFYLLLVTYVIAFLIMIFAYAKEEFVAIS
ncbi:Nodule Cysteine-Rich (NCR) secreted peptide [Flavobacterium cucumis]|uniref:Uncharacterized protein n=1 Tax=Flavobacterium cucumis TaxID=416016 RepID=A0A1M7ZYC5_9FLAO|nr:hypothetical protein SAMN05443547_2184 [Flavobacterium cucumis]